MAKWYFKIEAGDFNAGGWGIYSDSWFTKKVYLPRWLWYNTYYAKDIVSVQLVTEDMLKAGPGKGESVAVGLLLLGPLGAALGALLGGKQKKQIVFSITFADGKSAVCTSDQQAFMKVKSLAV